MTRRFARLMFILSMVIDCKPMTGSVCSWFSLDHHNLMYRHLLKDIVSKEEKTTLYIHILRICLYTDIEGGRKMNYCYNSN